MKILGIDTSTRFLSLGTYDQGRICEYNIDLDRKHSSLLTVVIKRVTEALEWKSADIDYFACGLGPGSFTGVRVGLATIKGLAWSLKKPIVGISTLDILAKNVNTSDGYIVPALDAKRNLIYCCLYKIKDATPKRITPYMLLTKDEFFRKIGNIKHRTLNTKQTKIFGDATGIYKEDILKNIKKVMILDSDYWYPKGHNIIELAVEKIRKKQLNNAFNIRPIYLYPKECQIKKNA